ncbi:MAG TPA: helix-turn-helix domain-containing protein [Gaiellaceae bacterium]|nr:helix-turn-helix domain-containing protein [Gaiellaceae bacterium]
MTEPVLYERLPEATRIGARLRVQRERLGISLREVARRIGVSPSLVSQIERDMVNPSVSTLYALVTVLGLTMSDVFDDAARSRGGPATADANGPVTTPETRHIINLAAGVRWERLTSASDPLVEFLYVVYEAGGESCPPDSLMRHGGKEYGYVISGRLGVTIGFDDYELGPGCSISFDSSSPHRLRAIGSRPVRAIWAVVGRQGDPRGAPRA